MPKAASLNFRDVMQRLQSAKLVTCRGQGLCFFWVLGPKAEKPETLEL